METHYAYADQFDTEALEALGDEALSLAKEHNQGLAEKIAELDEEARRERIRQVIRDGIGL